ncbi:MAG: sugar ABC transporter ATP-binding protein [Gemmataceae bacterium]
MSHETPLLSMRGISKSYPGVQALRGVDLTLHRGEVLALLGENGAGKSTLIKILGGAQEADAGVIRLADQPIRLRNPHEAQRAGIAVVHQECNLVPALGPSENIFLGREPGVAGFISRAEERRRTAAIFERLGVQIDVDVPCRTLSPGQQQLVEIARALAFDARVIVLDEPTAALSSAEAERLFAIVRDLRAQGIGIITITHRLDEVFAHADRIIVLRDGANVGEMAVRDAVRERLVEMMVGRALTSEFPPREAAIGSVRLEVSHLSRGDVVRDVSFSVRAGEVLAVTGLVGSGRTEMLRLVFGADRRDAGAIRLDGRTLAIHSPRDAIAAGIGLLTEDRKSQGLILKHSLRDNFALPNLPRLSLAGFVRSGAEREEFAGYLQSLHIKATNSEQSAGELSGGNQQKVVLAKWLARHCEVLLFDEPTRGIDVGAKYEIYLLIHSLAAQGKAIVLVSSEMPEVLGMADRILVMHDGRITGEIADARTASPEQVLRLAMA